MIDFGILSKLTIEAYKNVNEKNRCNLIATLNEVYDKLLYNIDINCYDLTYKLEAKEIEKNMIKKILNDNRLIYIGEEGIVNPTQLNVFKISVKKLLLM